VDNAIYAEQEDLDKYPELKNVIDSYREITRMVFENSGIVNELPYRPDTGGAAKPAKKTKE
jgi:hypothetical protein